MAQGNNYLLGVFGDDDLALKAVKDIRAKQVAIEEVYSPFPVHGMDKALGYKRSRLPIAAFLFGLTGTSLALIMQFGMMYFDWPMIIGGKPYGPLPSFVPVMFELTVLFAAFGMCFTFFVRQDMKPWAKPRVFDPRATDDKHIVAVNLASNRLTSAEISAILRSSGAEEVNEKSFED